jgi:hypothetical protein
MKAPIFGVSSAHTSVPHPEGGLIDPAGKRAVFLIEAPSSAPAAWRDLFGSDSSIVLKLDQTAGCVAKLEELVASRLSEAEVGVRLYICGSDAFVRRFQALAFEFGAVPAEIATVTIGEEIRVWCTHCKAITEAPASNLVDCYNCGRALLVYHHFSRRHGAYMGFQADAEVPGALPETEPGLPWA